MEFKSFKYLIVFLLTIYMFPVLAQSKKTIRFLKSAKQEMNVCNYYNAIIRLDKIIESEEFNMEALFLRGICKDSLKLYDESLEIIDDE